MSWGFAHPTLAEGACFAVATDNCLFWIAESDKHVLDCLKTSEEYGPPYPCQQWAKAGRLATQMTLATMQPDAEQPKVWITHRVHQIDKTDKAGWGWVYWSHDFSSDDCRGLPLCFANQNVEPTAPLWGDEKAFDAALLGDPWGTLPNDH
ncbi:MAG: hypothetical protein LBL69_04450, partial [Zoogloeaceae bacterium]|nr:hypothetical protein [Zoogloeaceae bacterium]